MKQRYNCVNFFEEGQTNGWINSCSIRNESYEDNISIILKLSVPKNFSHINESEWLEFVSEEIA